MSVATTAAKKSKNNNLFEARNGTKKNPISATTVTRFISLLSYSTCECLIYSEKYAEQKKNCVCVFVHAELMLSSTSQGFLFLILFFPKLYIFRAAFVRSFGWFLFYYFPSTARILQCYKFRMMTAFRWTHTVINFSKNQFRIHSRERWMWPFFRNWFNISGAFGTEIVMLFAVAASNENQMECKNIWIAIICRAI